MSQQAVDVAVIGAGFGGIYALHRLRGLGFTVQGFETGKDVGGTWYWNRYPGARCDVESMDYSYSFDPELEQEWEWTERFATQPEIQRYIAHVADRYDLRPLIRFETKVTAATWDADSERWQVTTDAGDTLAARFVVMATGSLSAAKTPDLPGLKDFAGQIYFTSSWPEAGVDFTGKTVGVIGTGSSAIQAIPLIAKQAEHVTVFQRTPNFTMPARNAPMTADYQADFKRNYRQHRADVRLTRPGVKFPGTGKSAHAVTDDERRAAYENAWTIGGACLNNTFIDIMLDRTANDTAAEFVRSKIREIVADPDTAEALSPRGYPLGSKRVAVDTDYYTTFNRPNVTLVDLRKAPLETITESGIRTAAGETDFDILVLATGFDAMTGSFLRVNVTGADGRTLADAWAAGPRTYLGLMTGGFPNLFFVAGPGSPSVLSNMVLSIEQHVEWIADALAAMQAKGETVIAAEPSAEDDWVDTVNRNAAATLFMAGDSWYLGANVPGKPRVFMPFIGGVGTYRQICDEIAADNYRGFARH